MQKAELLEEVHREHIIARTHLIQIHTILVENIMKNQHILAYFCLRGHTEYNKEKWQTVCLHSSSPVSLTTRSAQCFSNLPAPQVAFFWFHKCTGRFQTTAYGFQSGAFDKMARVMQTSTSLFCVF